MGNALIFSLLLIVGIFIGAVIAFIITALKKKNEEHKASNIIEKSKKDAEKSKRDALLEAKEESYKLKLETEKEIKEKDLKENEERLIKREDGIAKRDELLQNREQMLDEKENGIIQKQKDIQKLEEKVENIIKEQIDKLEKISGFSKNAPSSRYPVFCLHCSRSSAPFLRRYPSASLSILAVSAICSTVFPLISFSMAGST